jgi:hypothetical protein
MEAQMPDPIATAPTVDGRPKRPARLTDERLAAVVTAAYLLNLRSR